LIPPDGTRLIAVRETVNTLGCVCPPILCVQIRLTFLMEEGSIEAKAKSLVATMAGQSESDDLKPIVKPLSEW